MKQKGKSSHELLDDEKLSKIPAVHPETIAEHKRAAKKREKSPEVTSMHMIITICRGQS